ncbi:nuclear transport factor 2 family protein [Actinomadura fibrosa]|uniref:Nuclear transport factor 2 family protein n=1 Tax=Actinomadura fibrosa TaxID=111802 RepID=A0ABW2Y0Z1_9ACTN|nr:nuclear transport factor 2 family protein [Actinomadura fibrosa]
MVDRSNEDQVRAVVEEWASAVRAGDMDGVLANHTDDVLMYDVVDPPRLRGLADYRKQWELFFDYSPGGDGSFDLLDLEISAGDDVAWCQAMIAIVDLRCRLTLGLRREDGRWKIAHEHHSFPGDTPG